MPLFVTSVFLAVALFGIGLAAKLTRSKLLEQLEGSEPLSNKDYLKTLSRRAVWFVNSLGINIDFDKLDKKLYLAGRPFNLEAEELIGVMSVVFGVTLIICLTLWMGGVLPPFFCVFLIFAVIAVPVVKIRGDIEVGREKLRNELVDFCQNLELATSSGLQPVRVIAWAGEGNGLLAGILREIRKEVELGKYLHKLFARMADDYELHEAKEVAQALKHAELQGLSVSKHLIELNRDFRNRREIDLETRVSKLKPGVTSILVLCTIIAGGFLMLGPIVADNLENLRGITAQF